MACLPPPHFLCQPAAIFNIELSISNKSILLDWINIEFHYKLTYFSGIRTGILGEGYDEFVISENAGNVGGEKMKSLWHPPYPSGHLSACAQKGGRWGHNHLENFLDFMNRLGQDWAQKIS